MPEKVVSIKVVPKNLSHAEESRAGKSRAKKVRREKSCPKKACRKKLELAVKEPDVVEKNFMKKLDGTNWVPYY